MKNTVLLISFQQAEVFYMSEKHSGSNETNKKEQISISAKTS